MTEQELLEKVIKGLECCISDGLDCPDDCPYIGDCNRDQLHGDALALLKVQEPQGTPEAEWLLYKGMRGATCSYCKYTFGDVYDVENYDYYCRHCGAKMIRMRTVKWK